MGVWEAGDNRASQRPPLALPWPPPSFLLPCPVFDFSQDYRCLLSHLCFLAFWVLLTCLPGLRFYLGKETFFFSLSLLPSCILIRTHRLLGDNICKGLSGKDSKIKGTLNLPAHWQPPR